MFDLAKYYKFNKNGVLIKELKECLETTRELLFILLEEAINNIVSSEKVETSFFWIFLRYNSWQEKCFFTNFIDKCAENAINDILGGNIDNYYKKTYPLATQNIHNIRAALKCMQMEPIFKGEKTTIVSSYIEEVDFNRNSENEKYILKRDSKAFIIEDSLHFLNMEGMQNKNVNLSFEDWRKYNHLLAFIEDNKNKLLYHISLKENNSEIENEVFLENEDFFLQNQQEICKRFYNKDIICLYNLSHIDFTDKNISGLDFSHNLEARIHFDKIVKDIANCNFNGYNLSHVFFKKFNLEDTDLRNTGAIVDLSNCAISFEGKMNRGTLFDTDNVLMYGEKKLSEEETRNLGIKVYQKTREEKIK